jgi:hypothetical protein
LDPDSEGQNAENFAEKYVKFDFNHVSLSYFFLWKNDKKGRKKVLKMFYSSFFFSQSDSKSATLVPGPGVV